MSNLDTFKTYLTNNQNDEAINFLNNTYFQGDKTYLLKVKDFGGDHAHAKTGGTESSPCITFKPAYLRRILTSPTNEEEVFAKCISTLRHERMHVTQLIKGEFRTKTPDELEFMAYSEELLPDSALPALSDVMWEAAWKKSDDHYGKLTIPSQAYQDRKTLIDQLRANK